MSGYVRLQSGCQMFQVVHPMDVATLRLLQQNSEDPVRDLGCFSNMWVPCFSVSPCFVVQFCQMWDNRNDLTISQKSRDKSARYDLE